MVLPEQFEESEEGRGADGGAEPEGGDGDSGERGDGDQAHLYHQFGGDAQQQHAGQQRNANKNQHTHGNGRALRALIKGRPWKWGFKGCPPVILFGSCCMFLPSVYGVFLIQVIGISRRQAAAAMACLNATPSGFQWRVRFHSDGPRDGRHGHGDIPLVAGGVDQIGAGARFGTDAKRR